MLEFIVTPTFIPSEDRKGLVLQASFSFSPNKGLPHTLNLITHVGVRGLAT
jgi:hypothetical protein